MAGGVITGPLARGSGALLAELHARCFAQAWSAASFEDFLETPGAAALVATQDGDPVGFVVYRLGADEAEIVTLGVRPESRISGAGRALVQAALAAMTASGVRSCFLEVAADNAPAQALYARAGFRRVGSRPDYYRDAGRRVDADVLRRDLVPGTGVPS
ncbi:ribosomal protein S18-alanine N-acetyltransferase [Desertibaculum subflavum]|uniref:ribosomal protein S18-alanine N-acetyltransferase n=1 Tax=Desertibaculum subflavum TaxID=2268458 RepID=UPI000E661087